MLAVSVFAAVTKKTNMGATVVVCLSVIVFAMATRASKRDLARVRKKFVERNVRSRCKRV